MTTVILNKVSKHYGQTTIIDSIDLTIHEGEFIALVGPSGCGKSTLLRMVAGLDTVTEGNILINDRCVNDIAADKRDMAMVFQSYALYPHMTVYNNMAYALKMRKMKKADIDKRVKEVASLLKISDCLNRKPQALSGGQRQRVAMGRAIVRSPSVFLFDEPLSNLDTSLRVQMRHEIKKLHQTLKTTSLYVTHDPMEAMTLASRIVVLNKGRLEQIGTPQDLYERPASLFVAEFTSVHPVNFLKGILDYQLMRIVLDNGLLLPLPKLKDGNDAQSVIVALRPEHLKIKEELSANATGYKIATIDSLGGEQLVYLTQPHDHSLLIIKHHGLLKDDHQVNIEIDYEKGNVFDVKTGLRLGGWV